MTYPDNVFSGIPGRSYIDNAKYHQNSNYFIKIDISKFFPNTHREKVYNFYKEKLIMSSDIAEIMTNLSTVNLSKISNNEVKDFVIKKEIKASNHLPSGSPISCVVSFLANFEMFNEIEKICLSNNCKVSFYIDDVTISSTHKIPKTILRKIKAITKKHFHEINMDKSKTYLANDYKKITGCIVSKEKELIVPNKIKYKIRLLKNNKYTIDKKINSVLGLINTAQIFEKQKYASLKYDITKKLT